MTERSADPAKGSAEAVILKDGDEPFDATERRAGAAHAAALKAQAAEGGLRFEAYLPSDLAVSLLDLISQGVFMDPSEAVFVMIGEQQDLAAYPDLRRELLRRTIEDAANDPHPGYSAEEVFAEIDAMLAAPMRPAAVWDTSITRPRRASAEQSELPGR